jgi:hypothetical protein
LDDLCQLATFNPNTKNKEIAVPSEDSSKKELDVGASVETGSFEMMKGR